MIDDVAKHARKGASAESLAQFFLKDYFADKAIEFPLNPFQMLTDLGIPFIFRPFNKYEGIYVPAADEDDIPVVGINLKRPITRQRYTAAHELCHHIKDADSGSMCLSFSKSFKERFAEDFAAELLMPNEEFKRQVSLYETKDGNIDDDGVLKVADYFGVSYKSCLNKIAYKLHKIKGNTSPEQLEKRAKKYKPATKRKEQGYKDLVLYEQLFDAIGERFNINPTPFACQKFKNEYIYFDSRMEDIDIDQETAAEIVMDIRENKQCSKYCSEQNRNIIEVAGLTLAYDYVFENADSEITIYDAKNINEKLFSTAPYPVGGRYRESNTLVLGAKFETIDYHDIPREMRQLDKEIQYILRDIETLEYSEYIKAFVRIHYALTVIHAFRDGNGRTYRAFANMFFLKKRIPPVFFKNEDKDAYKDALAVVDATGDHSDLYELFFKAILSSYTVLSNFSR